ncbi:MAG: hypothetical protein IKY53_00730, partial [Lachnospiraceae bacterium]|nr:hypothetical protein [Kiritimatiellia bacterium]MBR4965000.1 hypothetical protein [Lachnospiraceae bacterium]
FGKILYFPDLDAKGREKLIDRACLRADDKRIAKLYFVKGEDQADIGVDGMVHLSRSAVGKRIKKKIIPELERVYLLKAQ